MKYFLILLLVAWVHSEEEFVPKTRPEVDAIIDKCFSTLGIDKETFDKKGWTIHTDNDLNRSMIKCTSIGLGFFVDTEDGLKGFNKSLMVKQFGGETVRVTVETCIDNNPIGEPTEDKSIQKVINCLSDEKLEMYN